MLQKRTPALQLAPAVLMARPDERNGIKQARCI